MDKKWLCAPSVDTELWYAKEYYDSKQEAIVAGTAAVKRFNADPENENISDEIGYFPDDMDKITSFAVGQVERFQNSIDVDVVIEYVQEQAYDQCGESAEDYLDDVLQEHKDELEELILSWFQKHGYAAGFGTIENTEEVVIEEDC